MCTRIFLISLFLLLCSCSTFLHPLHQGHNFDISAQVGKSNELIKSFLQLQRTQNQRLEAQAKQIGQLIGTQTTNHKVTNNSLGNNDLWLILGIMAILGIIFGVCFVMNREISSKNSQELRREFEDLKQKR